jgi:hypothetical protein
MSCYERNLLGLNYTGIGPKKCVLAVILQVFVHIIKQSFSCVCETAQSERQCFFDKADSLNLQAGNNEVRI